MSTRLPGGRVNEVDNLAGNQRFFVILDSTLLTHSFFSDSELFHRCFKRVQVSLLFTRWMIDFIVYLFQIFLKRRLVVRSPYLDKERLIVRPPRLG